MRVISWEAYTAGVNRSRDEPERALTIGVFDGVHRGHQALLQKVLAVSGGGSVPAIAAVLSFRQHPLSVLKAGAFPGDIFTLEQKLAAFEEMGIAEAVLVDFSVHFSTMSGRDFLRLLLQSRPVRCIALGRNFRCGFRQDTGAPEIQAAARARGIEAWVADPVMDGDLPVSSSRIRTALAAGDYAQARRLLGGLRIHEALSLEAVRRRFESGERPACGGD
jgi:riboflavin kinase/FMN adenylyltransferase